MHTRTSLFRRLEAISKIRDSDIRRTERGAENQANPAAESFTVKRD